MPMRLFVSLCLIFLVSGFSAAYAQDASPSLAGKWEITLEFVCGKATHIATISQKESALTGNYKGSVKEGQLRGRVSGDTVNFSTTLRNDTATAPFNFTGTVKGDTMEGTVAMGEYWNAKFIARKTGN